MNKPSAAGIFLSLVACTGVAFAIFELRKLRDSLHDLEGRLAQSDAGSPVPGKAVGSGGASDNSPKTVAEIAEEMNKLRVELGAVKTSTETLEAAMAGESKPVKRDGGTVASEDAIKAAVEKALKERDEARDKERRERGARWGGDMAAGFTNSILDTLTKELGLTEQQKTQVSEILKAQSTAIMGAWTNREEGTDPMAKMQEVRKDTDTKIKAVLTPEQGTKYDELAKDPAKLGGGTGGGFGPPRTGDTSPQGGGSSGK